MAFDINTARLVSRFNPATAQPVHEGMDHLTSSGQASPLADLLIKNNLTQRGIIPEEGLQGGVPTESFTGLQLSPLDLIGTGLGAKLAGFGAAGLSALGATAIASRASKGAKFPELASALSGQRGATAWHGSPHLFDKFKNEAIGTGEGAQAYGMGHYLAENPKVAQSYKETLSDKKVTINGRPINIALPDELAAAVLVQSKGDKDAAIQYLKSNLQYAKGDSVTKLNNAIESLNSGRQLPVAETSGAFYKTDIPDAHIDKMLDWDKPLSEQHPDVQSAIKNASIAHDFPIDHNPTGAEVYGMMRAPTDVGSKGASDYLQSQGLTGIKYLDGSSRTAGEGTRNFVMFNPGDIRILERNGVPTGQKPWDAPK